MSRDNPDALSPFEDSFVVARQLRIHAPKHYSRKDGNRRYWMLEAAQHIEELYLVSLKAIRGLGPAEVPTGAGDEPPDLNHQGDRTMKRTEAKKGKGNKPPGKGGKRPC